MKSWSTLSLLSVGTSIVVLGAGLALAAPASATDTDHTTSTTLNAAAGTAEVERVYEHIQSGDSVDVAPLMCPAEAPYLNRTEYHPGSGWRIPRGVGLLQSGTNLDASIMGIPGGPYRDQHVGVGGWGSTMTNWSGGYNTITLRLHCTTAWG
jgi:hypothetical protein